jgi:predicted  nucleic acid-binding Zn-ribbon protein
VAQVVKLEERNAELEKSKAAAEAREVELEKDANDLFEQKAVLERKSFFCSVRLVQLRAQVDELKEHLSSKGEDDSAGEAKDAIIAALRAELVRRDTVEVFDVDSGETTEAPAPKRQRTDATSGIAVLAENAEAAKNLLVRVKDEKQRAEEEKEEAQDLLSPLNKTINALQTKIDELAALAKASGADPRAISVIKERSNV